MCWDAGRFSLRGRGAGQGREGGEKEGRRMMGKLIECVLGEDRD